MRLSWPLWWKKGPETELEVKSQASMEEVVGKLSKKTSRNGEKIGS